MVTQANATTRGTASTDRWQRAVTRFPRSHTITTDIKAGNGDLQELPKRCLTRGEVSSQMTPPEPWPCNRERTPQVAGLPRGNDTIQTDVFYCRDVIGANHAILGIIDQSTPLHQACRLKDMSSNHTLEIFRNLWFKPYGFPATIRTDPGTNFGLHFKHYVERHGIWLEVIPAEAHWRIGLIERRNSVLRDILERIIDAESIFVNEDFDQAIKAPDILRAEAIKALADINTSQALWRALLRKTATSNLTDLQPGQNCAYWRCKCLKDDPPRRREPGSWLVSCPMTLMASPPASTRGTTTVHVASRSSWLRVMATPK